MNISDITDLLKAIAGVIVAFPLIALKNSIHLDAFTAK